jgi:hypothetical protein
LKYRFGIDVWGLALFLLLMIPTLLAAGFAVCHLVFAIVNFIR